MRYDEPRHRVEVARKNQQLSTEQFRRRVIEVVTQAVAAYWELDYARRILDVQVEAVRLAEQQYEGNRRLAEQGVLAPVDVVAAQTQVANFQQNVFLAQQALTAAENNLKSRMLPSRDDLMWSNELVPDTEPKTDVILPALDEAVRQALGSRGELAENAVALDINALDARLNKELAKPRVDLFANLTAAGLSGVPLPAGQNPLSQFSARRDRHVARHVRRDLRAIGEQPVRRQLPDRANGHSDLDAFTQSDGAKRSPQSRPPKAAGCEPFATRSGWRSKPTYGIRCKARRPAQSRLEAAELTRRSAEEQYSSEQRQFQAGTSTVFLVLQRQSDLIVARSREVRARADLAEALANLDRATARTLEAQGVEAK